MGLPAVLAAVAPMVVGGVSAYMSHKGQKEANLQNIREAQKDRDFQERMSSTAWQRGMADMKAAGLNPLLAFDKGGASTPGGRSARVDDAIGPAVSTATQLLRLRKELDLIDAQSESARQQAYKHMSDGIYTQTLNQIAAEGKQFTKGGRVIPYEVIRRREQAGLTASQRALVDYQRHLMKLSEGAAEISGKTWAGVIRALLGGGGLSPILRR